MLREVVRALRAGDRSVYPEDIEDATGLRWSQVQAAAASLERCALVEVVHSQHFGVLRITGVHPVLRPLADAPRTR